MGTIGYRLTIGKTYQSQYSWILPYSLIKVKSDYSLTRLRGLQNKFDEYSSPEYNILVGYDKGYMMTEFELGKTDANLDRSEGWLEEGYGLDQLIAHLRMAGDYSDSYIAGYVSVVFGK